MIFILFVLHDTAQIDPVLEAWENAGVSGITILPSTGLRRRKKSASLREDFPLIPSLQDMLSYDESLNRTLFTVVKDQEIADRVLAATQEVVGDLNLPNTGILVMLPVLQAYGLNRI